VGEVQFLSDLPDRRIAAAIEAALRACPWQAGSDASGQPIALWVILPLRFQGS
jgi:protein TonB